LAELGSVAQTILAPATKGIHWWDGGGKDHNLNRAKRSKIEEEWQWQWSGVLQNFKIDLLAEQ